MKTYQRILVTSLSLLSSLVWGQQHDEKDHLQDTIVLVNGKKYEVELKLNSSKPEIRKTIEEFKSSVVLKSFKSSSEINGVLKGIKLSNDPCTNGGFENDYAGWTGLKLRHNVEVLPIENG